MKIMLSLDKIVQWAWSWHWSWCYVSESWGSWAKFRARVTRTDKVVRSVSWRLIFTLGQNQLHAGTHRTQGCEVFSEAHNCNFVTLEDVSSQYKWCNKSSQAGQYLINTPHSRHRTVVTVITRGDQAQDDKNCLWGGWEVSCYPPLSPRAPGHSLTHILHFNFLQQRPHLPPPQHYVLLWLARFLHRS